MILTVHIFPRHSNRFIKQMKVQKAPRTSHVGGQEYVVEDGLIHVGRPVLQAYSCRGVRRKIARNCLSGMNGWMKRYKPTPAGKSKGKLLRSV
jgi:hypothetical protein